MVTYTRNQLRAAAISIIAIAIVCVFPFQGLAQDKGTTRPDNYVVMLSLDGFRWDYSALYNTPNLNQIAKDGVKADAMIPCYPSKTFPNHYSMATGLYPDNHGIVNNSFYDSDLGFFSNNDRQSVEFPDFYGGEPIWIAAEKQGVKSAAFYWVGTEAQINGIQPTYWKKYNKNVPFSYRIDTVLHWLTLPEEVRPRLILWHYQEPDRTSHDYGPTSPQTKACIEQIDSLLGIFIKKIKALPIASKINIIVVSDHGMISISRDKLINLSDHLNKDWFDVMSGGNPVYNLQPKEQYRKQALDILKKIPNLKVWERDSIPKRYHYGRNPRVCSILIEANLGYSISWADDKESYSGGTHGYDNQYPEMRGIFYAFGPAFKKGYQQPPFMNIDLYPLISYILKIKVVHVDGRIGEVIGMLK
ncbi:MAG: alkaline phosphatase family protein [Bacteroidales bacterium]|nr:MAG: alkaline phosphatase family protein [Bacteroidales bacterium]